MADEKLNVSPEGAPAQDAPAPEPPAPENAPEQTGGEPPAQDAPAGAPGAVNVSAPKPRFYCPHCPASRSWRS